MTRSNVRISNVRIPESHDLSGFLSIHGGDDESGETTSNTGVINNYI